MSDSLSFEFEFDKNDLSALTKAIHVPWWMRLLKWVGVALGLVLTVIVGFALLVLRVSLTEFEIVVVLVGLLFALGLLLIFEPTMRALIVNRDSGGLLGRRQSWTTNSERLSIKGEGAEGSFDWSKVLRVVETKDGFLLYTTPAIVHWIPARALDTEENKTLLRQWTQAS